MAQYLQKGRAVYVEGRLRVEEYTGKEGGPRYSLEVNATDPQFLGYHFWLNKLNQFDGDYVQAEMVRAFIEPIEYRQRFGQ